MKGKTLFFGTGGLLLVAAVGLWYWVLGPTQEASGPISAIPIELESTPTNSTGGSTATAVSTVTVPAAETSETAPAPTASPAEASQATPTLAAPATIGLTIFQISQADSEVRFIIYEELRGQPNNVVGKTDQVAGEIAVDPSELSTAQIGVVLVNARALVTDNDRRNQAIRNLILNTDSFEFITFTPREIVGLNGSAALDETFTFQIVGDLTIRDVTNAVTFEVTVKADSATRLSVTAGATIKRSDYELIIPNVPSVANVGEEVKLEIDFVAVARTSN
ncbi:MAG TPA: YceI family protein [Anaerolineales bacterium]|nr:YceI family protein [Anaerolineales bacterium]